MDRTHVPDNGQELQSTQPRGSSVPAPTVEEARVASLKVLALTLLRQVESLEKQMTTTDVPELNLQKEVQRFEAAIIRSALWKTGGRQRRAARLLGVKVTTLNTKIKRHKIKLDDMIPESQVDTAPQLNEQLRPS
jgi:transcriptional regulator with GAF, ATPase, and Fis domain